MECIFHVVRIGLFVDEGNNDVAHLDDIAIAQHDAVAIKQTLTADKGRVLVVGILDNGAHTAVIKASDLDDGVHAAHGAIVGWNLQRCGRSCGLAAYGVDTKDEGVLCCAVKQLPDIGVGNATHDVGTELLCIVVIDRRKIGLLFEFHLQVGVAIGATNGALCLVASVSDIKEHTTFWTFNTNRLHGSWRLGRGSIAATQRFKGFKESKRLRRDRRESKRLRRCSKVQAFKRSKGEEYCRQRFDSVPPHSIGMTKRDQRRWQ